MSVVEGYDARKKFNVQVLGGTLPPQKNNKSKGQEGEGEDDTTVATPTENIPEEPTAEAAQLETSSAESIQPELPTDAAVDPASERIAEEASNTQVQEAADGKEQASEVKVEGTIALEETNVA